MSEKKIKSALELAMERMDAETDAVQPLSDEQKARLAEIDKRAEAKKAEMEIMHQQNVASTGGDYLKVLELEEAMQNALRKIDEEVEEDKQAVREDGSDQ